MDIGDPDLAAHIAWMRLRRLSPATIALRTTAAHSLLRHAGRPAAEVTAGDLDGWQRALAVCDSSRASYVSQLRCLCWWMVEHGVRADDPSTVLVVPRLPRRVPRPISEDDLELALASAPDRIAPWLELASYAGLRAAEIAAIRRDDVHDHGDPPVLLVHGKGNRERVVPAAPRVLDALRRHGMPDRGWVFPRLDGGSGPNLPGTVSALSAQHLRSIGVPCTLHQLRHFFGTEVYRRSQDIRLTQDLLGHSSPTTTALYAAWSPVSATVVLELGRRAS